MNHAAIAGPRASPEKAIASGCVIVNQILIVPPLACFASILPGGGDSEMCNCHATVF